MPFSLSSSSYVLSITSLPVLVTALLLLRDTMTIAMLIQLGQHLLGTGLDFQRFSPLSAWWEAWQQGKVLEMELRDLHQICRHRELKEREPRGLAWVSETPNHTQ